MRDISNFGNNLRDEIIEYRLEHETGHTLKIKFVDSGDKTTARLCLYSKTGEPLSETDEFPFDPAGQRAIDRVELIRGSSEGHEAEYEIKVLFRGGKDPVYCPVDDILATLRKELSNKITIDLDNSREDESSVITSKIYSNFSKDEEPIKLSESSFSLDDIKMTAQNISMIANAESEEAEPTPVFVADVKDKKVTVYDLDVKNSINISKAKIDALDVTGDVKLGTKRVEEGVEPEIIVNTTDQIVTVGHRLETKGSATFGNAVSVAETLTVGSTATLSGDASVKGTLRATNLAAANSTLLVNDSSVSVIGNTSINGDVTLTNSEREVSLTDTDFTINSMGDSPNSVTNKKYVDDYMSGAKSASGISITAGGQLKIGNTVLNEATLTKLIALVENTIETEEK